MNNEKILAELSDSDRVALLQNGLIAAATGNTRATDDPTYTELRRYFMQRSDTKDKLPIFVRQCNNLAQFWQWIKYQKPSYAERRHLIWDAFRPLIEYLEAQDRTPAVAPITNALESFDPGSVQAVWRKALDRRTADPEGAITAARTLLETVCKHVLDDAGATYPDDADLPRLWGMASERMNLAPSQHLEESFKAILGSCQQIVNRLGTLRNKISDAHGQGRRPVRPKPRHAELAVNLAGTMAAFLVATWMERETK
jgi:hypothetical protein